MIELADLKAALRVDSTIEDDYIAGLEAAAVAHVRSLTGGAGGTAAAATVSIAGSGIKDIWLPYSLTTPTVLERTYPGATGTAVTDFVAWGARLERSGDAGVWTLGYTYEVSGTLGYALGAEPADIRQAVIQLVTQWYEFRTPVLSGESVNEVPHGVKDLLAPYTPPVVA